MDIESFPEIWISANEVLNIRCADDFYGKGKSVKIINSIGQVVFFQSDYITNEVIINTCQFADGVYFVEFKIEGLAIDTERFIVRHH